MLVRQRFVLAGFLLGVSAAFRIFPVFFIVGGALPLFSASRRNATAGPVSRHFLGGAGVALVLCVGVSSAVYGPDKWRDWVRNISGHKEIYFANHIGYQKVATFSPETGNQNFFGTEGEELFALWNHALQARWTEDVASNLTFAAVFCSLLLLVSLRIPPVEAALLVGTGFLFFAGMPANYYFVYLAAYAAMLMRSTTPWGAFRFAVLLGLMVVIDCLPVLLPDDIVRSACVSLAIMIFLGVLTAGYAAEQLYGILSNSERRLILALATPSVFLLGAVIACSLIHAHHVRDSDRSVLPPALARSKIVVDEIDVGQPHSEQDHQFRGDPRTLTRRRLDCFGRVVTDDCRVNSSAQRFLLHGFQPGRDAQLIFRSDLFFDVSLTVHVDGQLVFSGAKHRVGSMFDYILVPIPKELLQRASVDVEISVGSGRDIGIFYVWGLQDARASAGGPGAGEKYIGIMPSEISNGRGANQVGVAEAPAAGTETNAMGSATEALFALTRGFTPATSRSTSISWNGSPMRLMS